MPRLTDVVTALVGDLTRAQDSANRLSRALSGKYREDRLLRAFPVPNAQLGEVTLELRFAVLAQTLAEPGGSAQPASAAPAVQPPTSVFLERGHLLAAAAVRAAVEAVRALPAPAAGPAEERQRLLEALQAERVAAALGDQMGLAVQRWFASHPHAADEEAALSAAVEVATGVVGEVLLADPDLRRHLPAGSDVERGFLGRLGGPFRGVLGELLRRVAAAERDRPALPELEVSVDAELLERLPERAVQALRLRVDMSSYRWVVLENGRDEELVEQG